MDRGRPGVKRHLVVDAKGTRLAVLTGPVNQHDSQMLAPTLDAIPAIRSDKRGWQRRRPDKLHADKGYDYPGVARNAVPAVSVPRIARRGVDSSQRLGRHRRVVERSTAWLNRYHRSGAVL